MTFLSFSLRYNESLVLVVGNHKRFLNLSNVIVLGFARWLLAADAADAAFSRNNKNLLFSV